MSDECLSRLSLALGFVEPASEIIDRVYAVYEMVDAQIRTSTCQMGLPCKKGCDACCHESVFLSAPEFLVVGAELLTAYSATQRRSLVEQMRTFARAFEDELELLETIESGPERDEVAARIKFRCPLLSDAGACTVYRARELNGRTFGHAWDGERDEAYGCELTHNHLRVIESPATRLFDARAARLALIEAVPMTDKVQVYPWWFENFGEYLQEPAD